MKLPIITLENKKKGDVDLSDAVYGAEVRVDIMNRVVHYQRNKARQGSHKTKTIAEISGSGKKPFKQKGTGNARQGSNFATHMRGGQTVFGPVVRSHATELPKKVRMLALRSALSSKVAEKKIIILDEAKSKSAKTKDMLAALKGLNLSSALVIFDGDLDDNFSRGISNIPHMNVLPQKAANVLAILKHDNLVLTEKAAKELEERLA